MAIRYAPAQKQDQPSDEEVLPPVYEYINPYVEIAPSQSGSISTPFSSPQIDDISKDKPVAADSTSAEKGLRDGVLNPELLADINAAAAKVPETGREQFIRITTLAATLACGGKASLNVPIFNCEDRFRETHAAYEKAPTSENAKALIAAYQNLRFRQKELRLAPQPRDEAVSLAESQSRPTQAKAAPSPPVPGKKRRGRPSLTATLR